MSEKSRKRDIQLAIQSGDPARLNSELNKVEDEGLVWSSYSILTDAAKAKQPEIVRWLIEERFPEIEPNRFNYEAAIFAGADVFRVFLGRFPDAPNEDLGESGNALGVAAFNKNIPMVEFLLAEGADPNKAKWMMIPMRRLFSSRWTKKVVWMPDFLCSTFFTREKMEEIEIYRLFVKYGFDPSRE